MSDLKAVAHADLTKTAHVNTSPQMYVSAWDVLYNCPNVYATKERITVFAVMLYASQADVPNMVMDVTFPPHV